MAIGPIFPNFNQAALEQQRYVSEAILDRGARNGSLSEAEFVDLNADRNQLEQLRDSFLQSGGISREEQQILDARQLAYAHKLDKYREGDYQPASPGGTPYDQAAHDQARKIYAGIREGSIDGQEGQALLLQQRAIAAGSEQRDPVSQQRKIDEAEFEIKLARKQMEPKVILGGVPNWPQFPPARPLPSFPTPPIGRGGLE